MRYTGKEYKLSSGRCFYAHQGILGLNDNLGALYNGYDGHVWLNGEDGGILEGLPFTPLERREIAEHMIALWNRFAESGIDPEKEAW